MSDFLAQVDYLVGLVGPDHVGVAAQDDWHRSEKDARRIKPYLPSYGDVVGGRKREYGRDYRIHRMEGQLGPALLNPESIHAEFNGRGYADDAIAKILGGNLMRVFGQVLPSRRGEGVSAGSAALGREAVAA